MAAAVAPPHGTESIACCSSCSLGRSEQAQPVFPGQVTALGWGLLWGPQDMWGWQLNIMCASTAGRVGAAPSGKGARALLGRRLGNVFQELREFIHWCEIPLPGDPAQLLQPREQGLFGGAGVLQIQFQFLRSAFVRGC